jgi:hypothetical protein
MCGRAATALLSVLPPPKTPLVVEKSPRKKRGENGNRNGRKPKGEDGDDRISLEAAMAAAV